MKLWEKGTKVDRFILQFTVGNDYLLDQKLARYDALASIAHAAALQKAGVLLPVEFKKLRAELRKIAGLAGKGKFRILPGQEDSHTAIENRLTGKLGELGRKIHAGRSRNDQVLAALRLYSKEKILETELETLQLCRQIISFAKKNQWTALPGYSHTRKAMPSSLGLWAASFAESLLDSLPLLDAAFELNNQSPLGAAAGFGSALELDRAFTAKLLGFRKAQHNVLAVQNSRGKMEGAIIAALSQIMLDLGKLSNDLILFSAPEFGFLELSAEVCTGSSIMPQKHNPDVLELIRAKSKAVQAKLFEVLSISGSIGSGYSRELQLTKQPLMDSFDEAINSVRAMQIVFKGLRADKGKCASACTPELFAADTALEMVKQGKPFRDAYREVARNLGKLGAVDALQNIRSKKMPGASGNLGLKKIGKAIAARERAAKKEARFFRTAMAKLL